MEQEVLVVGANGRIGRASVQAFLDAGWKVRAFVRSGSADRVRGGVTIFEGDAFDAQAVAASAEGVDVIVNALNPPYDRWADEVPRITASILHAAKTSGATVILPGSVYNYGEGMPRSLREDTPHAPTTRKGVMREEMEDAYRNAAADGVRTIVVRAGDYIEQKETGNWFDSQISNKVHKGVVTYPGPLDRVHSWAFLPDVARAMVELAQIRSTLDDFDTFGFAGFAVTGAELIAAMQSTVGRPLKVKTIPWPIIRMIGLFNPLMRELMEMRYLWDVPHGVDGSKLARALPDFRATELHVAISDALREQEAHSPARPVAVAP
ncbi:MAG: NAD-dependent epimerase/dehydratase family protein [Myxococcales bacterium]|nr:MAG: NAD-dependent epimerase/dehydratase family protein [Myxococcales bacterium]